MPRFGLSERGKQQARRTARFLAGRRPNVLYTSPLLRARQTAALFAASLTGLPVKVSSGLLEVRTSYQGSPNSILKPGFSFYEPQKSPSDETMRDVHERMFGVLRRTVTRHQGERIILVSHADPITILRLGLEGRDFTATELHTTVYAERASVTQITLIPDTPFHLTYFDVAETISGHVATTE